MNVSDCMTPNPRVCAPTATIQEAARAMKEIDSGFLPVGENDRLVGMITDRDIAVRGVAEGCGPSAKVRDVMSQEVKYCFDDADTDEVLGNMAEIQVRRMPVVDHDKRLVGIVSIGDLAKEEHRDTGKALGDIARPSGLHSQ